MSRDANYPRDLIGYGRDPVFAAWPGGVRVAVQFVLNYEEGGENCVLHGDVGSERFLSEIIGAESFPARHLSMESIYEYGSRAGVWRILREFEKRGLPLTVFGVSMAVERHPELTQVLVELGHEIACHGWRWIHYQNMDEATELEHMKRGIAIIETLTGKKPLGWYTGRDSPNTRRLLVDEGGFLYDSDYYGDDLPFWTEVTLSDGSAKPHLIVPYTLDTNDMRFATPQGFNTAEQFLISPRPQCFARFIGISRTRTFRRKVPACLGHLTASIGAVGPGAAKERDVIVCFGVSDVETNGGGLRPTTAARETLFKGSPLTGTPGLTSLNHMLRIV